MSTAPACIGPHPSPRKPRHQLPAGSTDCHCHVFEDPEKYPLTEHRSYTPPYLPLERYLAMCKTVGLTRTVQVNASVYGFDNKLSLDIIEQLGQDRARGVCGVSPDVTDEELSSACNDWRHSAARGSPPTSKATAAASSSTSWRRGSRRWAGKWHMQLHGRQERGNRGARIGS